MSRILLRRFGPVAALALLSLLPAGLIAQGTLADYVRADSFTARTRGLVVGVAEEPNWLPGGGRFWYRASVTGGNRFVMVDAATGQKSAAFDHERLATSLAAARRDTVPTTAISLPFQRFSYVDSARAIEFVWADTTWRCGLADYACSRGGAVPRRAGQSQAWSAGPGQLWRANEGDPVRSPDGKLEAVVRNYNVAIREVGTQQLTYLSQDGSEGNMYTRASIVWSPDSRRLAVYRVVPGFKRELHYVQSSPEDQLQPKHSSILYAKPGDVLDREQPVIFDIASKQQLEVDNTLFPNAYNLSELEWRPDGQQLTFEYNQRGHTVYRVIEIDAATGGTRSVISEEPKTFFYYTDLNGGGRKYRFDVADGQEIVWSSERDGWNHLYLYDGRTGKVKNQITRGKWVVRGVDTVDVAKRQVWFRASGMKADQDPYFVHYYRINFDGSGLTALTNDNGTHSVSYSPDLQYYVDRWSRVDQPPVAVLRRGADASMVAELERADAAALLATGWRYPEVFVSKARDGETDIWGVIIRPTTFDPAKKYPVIENIYAGPHGSFVPKTFSTQPGMQSLAELGFIVVQVDGMGTSNRSKAFQDMAWKNIKDAGFPDRILWHRAIAAKHPYYDLSRVGIFGNSAGGQNAMGALLFHPDFYHVAVSSAGCHDNRMDKIWWNELWMSWPLGPHYAASSNVENAHLLQGRLLLVLPEMDTNVDPSSTMQVVNALIKANKDFDFLMVPNANHGNGGTYGVRKRNDYFVKHLLQVEPPFWNRATETTTTTQQ
jgi:dipeptidyl aminopeptidase/acylaminoacyl peptidase